MLIRATPRQTGDLSVFLKRASDIEAGNPPETNDEVDADVWFKSQSPAPARERRAEPPKPSPLPPPRSKLADALLAVAAVTTGFLAAVLVAGIITTAVGIGLAVTNNAPVADAAQIESAATNVAFRL